MKDNLKALKELSLQIRIFKKSRKKNSLDHGKYDIDEIPYMKSEARHRSIVQALKNRKIKIETLEDLTNSRSLKSLLEELGIETKIRDDTLLVSLSQICEYIRTDMNKNGANAA